jgi:hypothetical protein
LFRLRNITYSEKVIGGFQIVWGAFTLFVAIYGLKIFYDFGVTYFHLTLEKISIWKILKTYHFEFLLAILSLVSGFLLILNKKAGWQLAIITSFVTAMIGAVNLVDFFYRPDKIKFNKTTTILLDVTLITVFFLVSYILLLKPFRIKYNPTKVTWWAIIIIAGLLLVDKIILEMMN